MSSAGLVEVEDVSVPIGAARRAMVRIFRSEHAPRPSPVVLYLCDQFRRGAEAEPYDQVRAIAADTEAAVLVPRVTATPGHSDLESLYQVLHWIAVQGQRRWLDGDRVALAGHGSGAELCCRLALLASERGAPELRAGSLVCVPGNGRGAWREAARFLRPRSPK